MEQPIAERLRWRLWRTVVRLRISTEHWMPSHGVDEARRTLIERCQHEVPLGDLKAVLTHTGEGIP
jgi:hypothetical protein